MQQERRTLVRYIHIDEYFRPKTFFRYERFAFPNQGDSGGPLQVSTMNGRQIVYHLIGVTSFGKACATTLPGVYTRVSHYLDWMETIVWSWWFAAIKLFRLTVVLFSRYEQLKTSKLKVDGINHKILVKWLEFFYHSSFGKPFMMQEYFVRATLSVEMIYRWRCTIWDRYLLVYVERAKGHGATNFYGRKFDIFFVKLSLQTGHYV